ncbi:serine hydrolase domain-containing protein [Anaerotalea alkaliphila]|uniref:Beta-lactamase family protein n=1 Tax=Anaerotalea alkaliphila TaxID=2662126 RepID=A0A7X5KN43_9FIRM|nr:serine hydrolase domain-containing protein [Anaerotalea alkaliphila]NDL66407.1 beta-lactamase family protein [Anaerotalea alkaliphila]
MRLEESYNRLLESSLDRLGKVRGVRHAFLAAESRDGTFQWAGAKGAANPDGTLVEVGTPFWIASVTKLYIASAILRLQESGQLSVDDLVVRHLPADLMKGVHVVDGTDFHDRLTIRHLLTHASGIPDYLELKLEGGETWIDRVLAGKDRSWSVGDILQAVARANKPLFAPQDLRRGKYRIRYSDTNYQILIAILESVTKKPVEDVYADLIFRPLGLAETFLPGGKSPLQPGTAMATTWVQDIPFDDKPLAMRSFGDLYSTLKDQIAFLRGLLEGKLFENPETLGLMRGGWQTFAFGFSPLAPGWPIQYGMGMMRFETPRFLSPLGAPPALVGHTGAVGSWLFHCPETDMLFAGTVSQATAAAAPFRIVPPLAGRLGTGLRKGN